MEITYKNVAGFHNDFYFPEKYVAYQEMQKYIPKQTAAMIGPEQGLLMGCINDNTSN